MVSAISPVSYQPPVWHIDNNWGVQPQQGAKVHAVTPPPQVTPSQAVFNHQPQDTISSMASHTSVSTSVNDSRRAPAPILPPANIEEMNKLEQQVNARRHSEHLLGNTRLF